MIRRIRLRQWRSYDALDLRLDAGTTFVVASNGVGKSSLMLGLAWAVFGEHSSVDARSCIRAGASSAEVEVELVLPDERTLTIQRTIAQRGLPKSSGVVEGTTLDDQHLTRLLEEAFGVDLDVAARLSLMAGGKQLASDEALNLKSHLYKAFGVAEMLTTAQLARKVAKDIEKERSATREVSKERIADRDALEREASHARVAREASKEQVHEQELVVKRVRESLRLAERMASYKDESLRYEQQLTALVEEARDVVEGLDSGIAHAEVVDRLNAAHGEFELAAKKASEASASARGVISAAQEAIGFLDAHTAVCPVCMREMTSKDLVGARNQHESRIQVATATAVENDLREEQLRLNAKNAANVSARLQVLRAPHLPPAGEAPALDAVQATLEAEVERLEGC
ncbi:MAG TPA: AAA family ATPase, partial [Polyangiaceae bacterium]|nr:AAA family ATPase [Polyangiaceae bacterium]